MGNFAHLHLHDQFSFLDGFGKTDEYVQQAKQMGLAAYVQTNHGGLWGVARAFKACKQVGIKFIPGVEFYLDSDAIDKARRRIAWEHLTVLAMNQEGYQNLLRLASLAGERMHRNRPILDYPTLFKNREGLIVLSGCSSGKIMRLINANDIDRAIKVLETFKRGFGDRFYVELQPANLPEYRSANPVLVELAHKLKLPLVVTNDVHYPKPSDAETHEVMLCVQTRDRIANPDRWKFAWDGFYFADDKTLRQWFRDHHSQVERRDVDAAFQGVSDIVDRCQVDQPIPSHFILPQIAKDPKAEFRGAVIAGFRARGLDKRHNAGAYRQRLKYEGATILKQGLHPYFLIVADLMQWARARMLVGPGRGSSGGSLICYCLGITDVDPLVHNTLFERFITEERADLPDIDMDFPASRREEIVEYLRQKYGSENVAGVATYIEFKGRLALRDVAKAFDVPLEEINKVAPLIITKSGGDARADMTVEDVATESPEFKVFAKRYPKVVKVAMRLEGTTRQLGKHAAGVAVTDKPCIYYFPTYRTKDGHRMSQWDKDDLEVLKLLKIDILGIDILDTITKTLKTIEARHNTKIEMVDLSLDDPKALAEFDAGNTVGVFQFESKGIAYWAKAIGVKKFKDIVDINALYRPGTLRSGTIKQYFLRKKGKQQWGYAHPYLKEILKDTYGIPLYQEQLMFIFNRLAGFKWRTTDTVRKVVSKSQGLEKFNSYWQDFLKGCQERGMTEAQAYEVFKTMRDFGAYGFNHSHAVEYSIIAYWCMWLKVHYPLEYLAVLVSNERSPERVALYLKEAHRLGIEIRTPQVGKSGWGYKIEGKALRIGFKDIKGIGEKAGRVLESMKGIALWKHFFEAIEKRVVNARVLKALLQAGATTDLRPAVPLKAVHEGEWARFEDLRRLKFDELPRIEYDDPMLATLRHEVFPIHVGPHPLTLYKDLLKQYPKVLPIEKLQWTSGIYLFAGVITNVGHSTIHRLGEDGVNRPKKLTYCTLDGEREYMVMMIRGGPGEPERVSAVKALNGKPVIVEVEVNADRNKVYLINVASLEEIRRKADEKKANEAGASKQPAVS
jgi:DNA polymerase-3 subunit alpha